MRFDGKKYHELFHAEETEAAQKTVSGEIVNPDPKKTRKQKRRKKQSLQKNRRKKM